jgi:hypothetical protein
MTVPQVVTLKANIYLREMLHLCMFISLYLNWDCGKIFCQMWPHYAKVLSVYWLLTPASLFFFTKTANFPPHLVYHLMVIPQRYSLQYVKAYSLT